VTATYIRLIRSSAPLSGQLLRRTVRRAFTPRSYPRCPLARPQPPPRPSRDAGNGCRRAPHGLVPAQPSTANGALRGVRGA
jgi:hypothetical protein